MDNVTSFSDRCRRLTLTAALVTVLAAPAAAWSATSNATGSATHAGVATTAQQCLSATGCKTKADGKTRKIEKAEKKLQETLRGRDEARAAKP